jgi:ribose-phosphate pyrophosphokinase
MNKIDVSELLIFSGSSNVGLTDKICKYLNVKKGLISRKVFSDGEIWIKFKENIRGREVYLIQSTMPPAENLMELLIMLDAAKRSSARRVTAVIPYFGYARQDRKDQPRVAVTAKLVADILTKAGADKVITMDLHAAQIQGFFDIPLDHLYASPIYTDEFEKNKRSDLVVVSPDVGGIKIARSYARKLHAGLVLIDKRRPEANKAEVMNIIGDVEGKNVLIVDDLIDTAGTFVASVAALKKRGAVKIYGAVTHALLSGDAIEKIENSEIDELYVSDTIPQNSLKPDSKIKIKTSATLFAESIIRSHQGESISSLFEIDKS